MTRNLNLSVTNGKTGKNKNKNGNNKKIVKIVKKEVGGGGEEEVVAAAAAGFFLGVERKKLLIAEQSTGSARQAERTTHRPVARKIDELGADTPRKPSLFLKCRNSLAVLQTNPL